MFFLCFLRMFLFGVLDVFPGCFEYLFFSLAYIFIHHGFQHGNSTGFQIVIEHQTKDKFKNEQKMAAKLGSEIS